MTDPGNAHGEVAPLGASPSLKGRVMPEGTNEEPKTTITRWIFATDQPRTITLTGGGTAPGRWDGTEWIEPTTFGASQAEFNQYSGLYITTNARNAKLIQALKSFRSDINPTGDVWLVDTEEVKGMGKAIPATAPAPQPRVAVVRSSRGTSDVARARSKAIKGIKKIKVDV